MDRTRKPFVLSALVVAILVSGGCNPLAPRPILHGGYRVAPELIVDAGPVIERGKPRPIIDGIGWVIGIPGRLLLWDPRIDNHHISHHTEAVVAGYIAENDLHHVKVRLNQYAPLDDWRRLRRNKTVGWGYRYTLGVLSLAGETILPGRIFGGDHFNPFTSTVHIYSDVPAIGLHEAAHAKDFSRRDYPGTYALVYLLPIVPLWHERIATGDVIDYVQWTEDEQLLREAYRVLYPAYGTYVGGALGYVMPDYADPIYVGAVIVGHAAAHHHAYQVPELAAIRHGAGAGFEDGDAGHHARAGQAASGYRMRQVAYARERPEKKDKETETESAVPTETDQTRRGGELSPIAKPRRSQSELSRWDEIVADAERTYKAAGGSPDEADRGGGGRPE